MTTETGYIYTLSDPRTEQVRYVGATRNPEQRLNSHIHAPHSDELADWVDELNSRGQEPQMKIINVATIENLGEKERAAVSKLSGRFDLINAETSPSYTDPHKGERTNNDTLLDATTESILDALVSAGGYATTGYLVDESGKSRPTVTKRLDRLKAADHIEYIHRPTAFWRLVDDPRGTEDSDAGE